MDPLVDFERECFLIAPLGEEESGVRTRSDLILQFIVRPAAEELGLSAVRGDELAAPGQITHRVIDHLLRARAAVADLTGRNPNVYYELAVRHMAQLPVALIVAADEQPLPFDVQQMSVIRFDHRDLKSADQCRRSIVRHLSAGLSGVVDSPITAVREMTQLSTENKIDQAVSELLGKMKETFYDRATSGPVITELIKSVDLPRPRGRNATSESPWKRPWTRRPNRPATLCSWKWTPALLSGMSHRRGPFGTTGSRLWRPSSRTSCSS